MSLILDGTNGLSDVDGTAGTPAIRGSDANTGVFFGTDIVGVSTGGSERMRVDASGNVGIGTSSPDARVGAHVASGDCFRAYKTTTGGFNAFNFFTANENVVGRIGVSSTNDNFFLGYDSTPVLTWNSSGNVLVGTTSSAGSFKFQVVNTSSSGNAVWLQNSSGNDRGILVMRHDNATGGTSGNMATFQNASGSTVGAINSNNTATAYNTSSDYRLKENIAPMTGALAKVAALKPCTYTWKADDSNGEGFIAHEVQEVAPYAVSGEKDGEQMQGVDYGKLTPILTAALQEAIAKIETLEARIAVLEAK